MSARARASRLPGPAGLLGILLAAATLLRLWLAARYFGFHGGDEVEILEEGFRLAFGHPYEPWPIRNLFVSTVFVAPALEAAALLGVDSTRSLVWVASFPAVALASLNVWLVFRLGRRWLAGEWPPLLAAALYAAHWIPLAYGSTVYPRTIATTFVLLAASVVAGSHRKFAGPALAGALMAVAFAVRYSEAIFLLPLAGAILLGEARRGDRVRGVIGLFAGFAAAGLVTVGASDALAWGKPFASLWEFTRFTLIERRASTDDPNQPWFWYLRRLPKWLPLALLPLVARGAMKRRGPEMLLFVLLPLAVLSAIHHKQLRYLAGVIPFVCLLGAAGAAAWWRAGRRRTVAALLAISAVLGLGGSSLLRKKSMAAVLAAEHLAAEPDVRAVALSQPWAYGGRLYLPPEIEVVALPKHPSTADLERLPAGIDRLGLWEDHLAAEPQLAGWLADRGYRATRTFRRGRSPPVVVMERRAPDSLRGAPGKRSKLSSES